MKILFGKDAQDVFCDSDLVTLGILPEGKLYETDINYLKQWLGSSYHADMNYLETNILARSDPSMVLEGVRSSICVALPFVNLPSFIDPKQYHVSRYSLLKNYHNIIRSQGSSVIKKLNEIFPDARFRLTVDSAPVFEKTRALKTLQGLRGKNTLFIHKDYGSFIFLANIFSTLSVEDLSPSFCSCSYSLPSNQDHPLSCVGCNKCKFSCPTGALSENGVDSRKCISYLTIEHKGKIQRQYWKYFKYSFFGCDICQNVCLYNKKIMDSQESQDSQESNNHKILDRSYYLLDLQLSFIKDPRSILFISQDRFSGIFQGTSFLRTGYINMLRNIILFLLSNKDPGFIDTINDPRIDQRVFDLLDKQELISEYETTH